MAHRKAGGSTQLGRDSISKRLGVKIFGNQKVNTGNIIVRQRGTKFHPGENVKRCNDDTLMALVNGVVKFSNKKVRAFTGKLVLRRYVSVIADENQTTTNELKPKRKLAAKKMASKKGIRAFAGNKPGKKKGPRKIAQKPNMRKTVKRDLKARQARKSK